MASSLCSGPCCTHGDTFAVSLVVSSPCFCRLKRRIPLKQRKHSLLSRPDLYILGSWLVVSLFLSSVRNVVCSVPSAAPTTVLPPPSVLPPLRLSDAGEAELYEPFPVPIPPRFFDLISLLLLLCGFLSTATFIIYQLRYSVEERSLSKELVHAATASVFLGLGISFLLLSCGVYY